MDEYIIDEKGEGGFCPFCHRREDPLQIGHNVFFWCRTHALRWFWVAPESAPEVPKTEASWKAWGELEQTTTALRPSRAWRPPAVMTEILARMSPEAIKRIWPLGPLASEESEPMFTVWPTADDDDPIDKHYKHPGNL